MCSEMLCYSSSSGSLPISPSALFLGRLTSRVAPRDARRAIIFAPSRPRTAPLGKDARPGPERDARGAVIFAPLGVS